MKKRVILIVLDSVGIGALPDAEKFGDAGAHTLKHIHEAMGGLTLPNLFELGLGNIENSGLPKVEAPKGCFMKAGEKTFAKDTTSGHWEMMGLVMDPPFRTFPQGFPEDFIRDFEKRIGRSVLGNTVASGTAIIQELGDAHVKSGSPIVYTSADSVFQIAAHEDVIPLEELYRICAVAREMLMGDMLVGRVIARPFTGKSGAYTRTENRKDYAVEPPQDTILDALAKKGLETVAIGKIEDIFCRRGIGRVDHTKNNPSGIEATLRYIEEGTGDLIFTNLVDFDMLYGHRNDAAGYAEALMYFDRNLPRILSACKEGDLLLITADHGCDPCHPGTDHTREYIPILAAGPACSGRGEIGTRESFADIGATVLAYLSGESWHCGSSFLSRLQQ